MTKGAARQGKGTDKVPKFDMTELIKNRNKRQAPAKAQAAPVAPAPVAVATYDGGDVQRLEELLDGVLDKIKSLRLAGMINKDGADWMTHNLIKCHAIIEGMK